jgi:hypothetical protein
MTFSSALREWTDSDGAAYILATTLVRNLRLFGDLGWVGTRIDTGAAVFGMIQIDQDQISKDSRGEDYVPVVGGRA